MTARMTGRRSTHLARLFGLWLSALVAAAAVQAPAAMAVAQDGARDEREKVRKKPGKKARKKPKKRQRQGRAQRPRQSSRRGQAQNRQGDRRREARPAGPDPAAATEDDDAVADSEVVKEGDGEVKVMSFTGMDVEGRLKSPQLLYFVNRVRAEFDRPALPHRSFMPELERSTHTEALK